MKRLRNCLAAVLAVALALSAPAAALAEAKPCPPPCERASEFCDLFLEKLAGKLGVEVGALKRATREAAQEALDEAAKKGLVSEKAASKLRQVLEGEKSFHPGAILKLLAPAKKEGKQPTAKSPERGKASKERCRSGLLEELKGLARKAEDLAGRLEKKFAGLFGRGQAAGARAA